VCLLGENCREGEIVVGGVESMGEPAGEAGREIANFRVRCTLVQSARVGYGTFLA
jgi:hypothetical protein